MLIVESALPIVGAGSPPNHFTAMFGNIGGAELMLIMLVILLVFGAKRIPEIARGLGQAIREFKAAAREISSEIRLEGDRSSTRVNSPWERTAGESTAARDARGAAPSTAFERERPPARHSAAADVNDLPRGDIPG